MEATLIDTIPVRCSLGESPVRDWRTKQLFWTDIHERRLYRYDLRSRDPVRFSIAERLCSFALSVPARQPSCVTFCGDDLRLLAVTSATEGLAGEQLGSEEGFTFLY